MVASSHQKNLIAGLAVLGIAALLTVLAVLGWQLVNPRQPEFSASLDELAALPGRPDEVPVLAAETPLSAATDARAINAAIPFFDGKPQLAPAFRFVGSADDRLRAVECLALAALAEAGGSDIGQRAVVQVVLNRVRHPAFARTVCGVVFQGSERRTGCQFSFTCDGSLARRYSTEAWQAARQRADAALGGAVFAPVGNATHYHTDWVHPYWSAKLVKLAQVETHLFFRWPGQWGSTAALQRAYRGGEPAPFDAAAAPSGSTIPLELASEAAVALPPDTPRITGGAVTMRDPTGKANFVLLSPGTTGPAALALARKLCPASGTCRVLGWAERGAIPAEFPLTPAARRALQFSFSRDPAGAEIVFYECRRFAETPQDQCMPRAR